MDMAAKEEAMKTLVIDEQARRTVGMCLRATESDLKRRAMLRAIVMGTQDLHEGSGIHNYMRVDART